MLFEAFRKASDKVDLRDRVSKPLSVLKEAKVGDGALPKALKAKAMAAMRFQVAV